MQSVLQNSREKGGVLNTPLPFLLNTMAKIYESENLIQYNSLTGKQEKVQIMILSDKEKDIQNKFYKRADKYVKKLKSIIRRQVQQYLNGNIKMVKYYESYYHETCKEFNEAIQSFYKSIGVMFDEKEYKMKYYEREKGKTE